MDRFECLLGTSLSRNGRRTTVNCNSLQGGWGVPMFSRSLSDLTHRLLVSAASPVKKNSCEPRFAIADPLICGYLSSYLWLFRLVFPFFLNLCSHGIQFFDVIRHADQVPFTLDRFEAPDQEFSEPHDLLDDAIDRFGSDLALGINFFAGFRL